MIIPKNDVRLLCDKRQFSIVMNNLVLNGIQAINGAGTIEVALAVNKDVIVIQIKDSGKGISKENIDKIFEPLFTTKQHGTGLGLASVKSIIELHGGIISVTSPPSIFTITLPKIVD
ncbi:MAG: GHKL domain-containing protein [Nitrosopumilus sp.]|nr:GHKL domain-containing protein [Nitrosopumilus sp.]